MVTGNSSSTTEPISSITREVDLAFTLLGGVSLVLLAGITLAMIWFAVRYNRKRARKTEQIEGNLWLEVTWVVIPTIIVTWMFFLGYEGFLLMRQVPDNAMVVQVTGQQWSWSFHYPDDDVSSTEMVVPVNRPVKVELTAPPEDVIHSFFIPDFRVKEDAVPGKDTYLWFESNREGEFDIFCAEYCGKDHSQMISELRVVSEVDYRSWIRSQIAKQYKPLELAALEDPQHPEFSPDKLNIDGARLYTTYCASCHGAEGDGSGLPGVARDFNDLSGWKKSPKVTDIYRTLTEGIDGTQMRAFPNFTPWEKVALAHEVRSFIPADLPSVTEEEYTALVEEYGLDEMTGPGETIPVERAMELMVAEAEEDGGTGGQTTEPDGGPPEQQ
jgi:cytochrome c oxidase subunit II